MLNKSGRWLPNQDYITRALEEEFIPEAHGKLICLLETTGDCSLAPPFFIPRVMEKLSGGHTIAGRASGIV